ncbi:hypothetical protein EDB83DRAFT_2322148 [Lactarius deliciosus]|nr:hypothetical protein EDB83DRAFT_2322148 [Lactarius deliciosus]
MVCEKQHEEKKEHLPVLSSSARVLGGFARQGDGGGGLEAMAGAMGRCVPEAGPSQANLGRAKPSHDDGLEMALARLRKVKSQSQRLKPGLWLSWSASWQYVLQPEPDTFPIQAVAYVKFGATQKHRVLRRAEALHVSSPDLVALARGLSSLNTMRFQYSRFHISSPDLAAFARGLSSLNTTRFRYRQLPMRSVTPDLIAPTRGLSNSAQMGPRSSQTYIRHFKPRGGLRDQCSARGAGTPESGPEQRHKGNSGAW